MNTKFFIILLVPFSLPAMRLATDAAHYLNGNEFQFGCMQRLAGEFEMVWVAGHRTDPKAQVLTRLAEHIIDAALRLHNANLADLDNDLAAAQLLVGKDQQALTAILHGHVEPEMPLITMQEFHRELHRIKKEIVEMRTTMTPRTHYDDVGGIDLVESASRANNRNKLDTENGLR